jgi:hypothetical protein
MNKETKTVKLESKTLLEKNLPRDLNQHQAYSCYYERLQSLHHKRNQKTSAGIENK